MGKRESYHVVHDGDENLWKVKREGADRASSTHDTKEEAVDKARELAKNNEPSQIIIHKQDGKIQEERTYGNDPYPPKG
ncbi:MAG: DUF2188 domain-containing protein [Candidatus Zixiibacteriota bacterium]|jgi:uncharacterized protein YdaT